MIFRLFCLCTFLMLITVSSSSGGITDPGELARKIMGARESGELDLLQSLTDQFRQLFPELQGPGENVPLHGDDGLSPIFATQPDAGKSEHTYLAQFTTIPPAYSGTVGTTSFVGPLATTARTYQLLIHDSLLTGLVGRELTAVSWRIPASATGDWPASDVTFSSYKIFLSGSVPPASRSFTFSANVVGPQTQVRSGSLGVTTGSYPSGSSPNGWGPEIAITPWMYSGGHLLIEIRHSGFTGTSRSVDAIGTAVSGYGTSFSAAWQSGDTSTVGVQGNFSVIRLTASDGVACKDVIVGNSWNIISVPLLAADMSVSALFPGAASQAFAYNNGYVATSTLVNGKGYWLKFVGPNTFSTCGDSPTPPDIAVNAGWNMIGPFDTDVNTSSITSTPPGIVASGYFGFNNGYVGATTIVSGKGYWVKTSQAGTLHIPTGAQLEK